MTSSSSHPASPVARAQPWLGTLVSIRVDRSPERDAHHAIAAAFHEIATVHHAMSFHSADSDVSRLNRAAAGESIPVHPHTYEVLQYALRLSQATQGCFDVTVGAELVHWQLLPSPGTPGAKRGSWSDMELLPANTVRLRQPVCIDLGGIAKGYAVDLAISSLRSSGVTNAVVNAGGDIRVLGDQAEHIRLSAGSAEACPVLELTDGSVASSTGSPQQTTETHQGCGPHVDGRTRLPAAADRFACVVAEQCVIADALTKVVLADGPGSAPVLRSFRASAYLHDPKYGWCGIETESSPGV